MARCSDPECANGRSSGFASCPIFCESALLVDHPSNAAAPCPAAPSPYQILCRATVSYRRRCARRPGAAAGSAAALNPALLSGLLAPLSKPRSTGVGLVFPGKKAISFPAASSFFNFKLVRCSAGALASIASAGADTAAAGAFASSSACPFTALAPLCGSAVSSSIMVRNIFHPSSAGALCASWRRNSLAPAGNTGLPETFTGEIILLFRTGVTGLLVMLGIVLFSYPSAAPNPLPRSQSDKTSTTPLLPSPQPFFFPAV